MNKQSRLPWEKEFSMNLNWLNNLFGKWQDYKIEIEK